MNGSVKTVVKKSNKKYMGKSTDFEPEEKPKYDDTAPFILVILTVISVLAFIAAFAFVR